MIPYTKLWENIANGANWIESFFVIAILSLWWSSRSDMNKVIKVNERERDHLVKQEAYWIKESQKLRHEYEDYMKGIVEQQRREMIQMKIPDPSKTENPK